MPIVIAGFPSSKKSPGFFGEVKYGAGKISGASKLRYLLIVGSKSTAGLGTADTEVRDITSEDDADVFWGPGAEGAIGAYIALKYPGVQVKGVIVATPGGAAAATATITIAGSWSAGGDLVYFLGNETISVSVASTHTPTTLAAAIAAAFNAKAKLPGAATSALGVVTVTIKSLGLRGNDWSLRQDKTRAPSGLTSALAGGAALTNGGVRFTGGTGQDDITNLVATLLPGEYYTIAAATAAAAGVTDPNVARWKSATATKAEIGTQVYEQFVFGHNGAYTDAQTIARTTLNDVFGEVAWEQKGDAHPMQLAASMAALRHQLEQDHPNRKFDGMVLKGVQAHREEADKPNASQIETALSNGVTPIQTVGSDATVVLAICTHCLNGSDPDYRTFTVGEARTPTRVFEHLELTWLSEYGVANEYVDDDPGEGEDFKQGRAYPKTWNATVEAELRRLEADNWITNVDENKPESEFVAAGKHIVTQLNVEVLPTHHRTGMRVAQLKNA
jgi:phage tail sheath gpL-like